MAAEDKNPVPLVEDADTGHRFLIYSTERGLDVELLYEGDTFWAPQSQMAAMFGVGVPAVSKHLKNIFEEGELDPDSVVSKMEITAADGKRYNTTIYNLNALISGEVSG